MTDEEKKALDAELTAIEALARKIEGSHKAVIYDSVRTDGHLLRIRIKPPNKEELGSLYDALIHALKRFTAESFAETQMRNRGLTLINDYAAYPKEVKVIGVMERSDGTVSELYEWYVTDEKLVLPDANGNLPMPLPPQAVMRVDSDYRGPKSWAARRYSHVLAFDE
jgi:hypothetical protein